MKASTFLRRANPPQLSHSEECHEGVAAAAGALILAKDTKRVLIGQRGILGDYPMTWGTIGGCLEKGEGPRTACRREIAEETGYLDPMSLIPLMIATSGPDFTYYNFLAVVSWEFEPVRDEENNAFKWCTFGDWPVPRHPGFDRLLNNYISMSTVRRQIYSLD